MACLKALFLLQFLLAQIISAAPPATGCSKNVILTLLSAHSTATPFCSSYLSIPTITATNIQTGTSTLNVNGQDTTTTLATTTLVILTTTSISTSWVTVWTSPAALVVPRKEKEPSKTSSKKLPPYLEDYPATKISSACSCLSIPTPTTTVPSSTITFTTLTLPGNYISATALESKTSTSISIITSTTTLAACTTPRTWGNAQTLRNTKYYAQTFNNIDGQGCCLKCYIDVPNCVSFDYLGDGFCAVDIATDGPIGAVTSNCPLGVGPLGGHYLFPLNDWDHFGIGPCMGPFSVPPV